MHMLAHESAIEFAGSGMNEKTVAGDKCIHYWSKVLAKRLQKTKGKVSLKNDTANRLYAESLFLPMLHMLIIFQHSLVLKFWLLQ